MFGLFGNKALRYQAHKDALDAGRQLLATYARGAGEKTWFDVAGIPLEYRFQLADRLDDIRAHVETTIVPAQVGNAELFRELLEDVTWAQMVVTGQVTAAGRAGMCALTFNHIFEELADTIEYQQTNMFADSGMSVLERDFGFATEALTWFRPGDTHPNLKVSPGDALSIYARARAILATRTVDRADERIDATDRSGSKESDALPRAAPAPPPPARRRPELSMAAKARVAAVASAVAIPRVVAEPEVVADESAQPSPAFTCAKCGVGRSWAWCVKCKAKCPATPQGS